MKRTPKFFIIHFPNNREILYRGYSWADMINVSQYVHNKYSEGTYIIPIRWYEVIKYLLGYKIRYEEQS